MQGDEEVTLIDREDNRIAKVRMCIRAEGEPLRSVIFQGRRFCETEAGPDSLYGPGELIEQYTEH